MLKSSQALTKLPLTVMSFLKPSNYMSILPPVSVALEFWDPISKEFPSEAAAGPERYWEKPGCRLLLMCPCSLTLKKHHQAYWKMFQWFKVIVFFFFLKTAQDFPGGLDGKESSYNAGGPGSIPGLGRSPWEGNGYPLQYSFLENSMGRGAHGLQSMESQRVGHN